MYGEGFDNKILFVGCIMWKVVFVGYVSSFLFDGLVESSYYDLRDVLMGSVWDFLVFVEYRVNIFCDGEWLNYYRKYG